MAFEPGASVVTRRGLFRLLGGAALSPVLKPLMRFVPETYEPVSYRVHLAVGTPPDSTQRIRLHEDWIAVLRRQTSMTKMCSEYNLPPREGKSISFYSYLLPGKDSFIL